MKKIIIGLSLFLLFAPLHSFASEYPDSAITQSWDNPDVVSDYYWFIQPTSTPIIIYNVNWSVDSLGVAGLADVPMYCLDQDYNATATIARYIARISGATTTGRAVNPIQYFHQQTICPTGYGIASYANTASSYHYQTSWVQITYAYAMDTSTTVLNQISLIIDALIVIVVAVLTYKFFKL